MNTNYAEVLDKVLKYFLKTNREIRILDIGCKCPSEIFKLYIKGLKINYYLGIDIKSEFEIYNSPDEDKSSPPSSLMYKRYKESHLDGEHELICSFEEFKKIFHFKFSSNAVEHFQVNEGKALFDLIILQNILHFIERDNAQIIFYNSCNLLNDTGLLQLSVLSSEYETKYEGANYLYSFEEYLKMKNQFNTFLWNSEICKSKFQFIGVKTTKEENYPRKKTSSA